MRSNKTTKKCQTKYKKAPGAPKRFKSAFMYYSENEHIAIRERNGNVKIRAADAAKIVSKSWKELCPEERAKWEELACKDKQRYEREKALYKGPWKVPEVKFLGGPKKPMSAYLKFANERRKAVVEANPSLSNAEISSLLGKLWKQCPLDIKARYRDHEKWLRAEWKREKDFAFLNAYKAGEGSSVYSGRNCVQQSLVEESHFMQVPISLPPLDICTNTLGNGSLVGWNFVSNENQNHERAPSTLRVIDSMQATAPHMVNLQKTPDMNVYRSTLEDYSLDELLQDEVLFEDFSTHDVGLIVRSSP